MLQPSYASYLNACFHLHLGSTKPLSSGDLRAVTNDAGSTRNRTITFTVINSPRLGRLVRVNSENSTEDVSVFTQTLVSPDVCAAGQGWVAAQGGSSSLHQVRPNPHAPLPRQLCSSNQTLCSEHRMTPLSEHSKQIQTLCLTNKKGSFYPEDRFKRKPKAEEWEKILQDMSG